MNRVLIMSSWTSVGHVGLSAATPVLQALGHHVTQLPTIILSNHRGWRHVAGRPIPAREILEMVDAIDANGWLDGHDTFLAGYMPSAEHVAVACKIADRLRRRPTVPRVVVDPILGDDPKGLYVDRDVADAVRDTLVPRADVLTPNTFELGWLTGRPTGTLRETHDAATALAGGAPDRDVLVTSPPLPADETGILALDRHGETLFRTPRLDDVPNGAGDVFSALIAAGLPVGAALGHLQALIEASAGAGHLDIVGSAERWKRGAAIDGSSLTRTKGA